MTEKGMDGGDKKGIFDSTTFLEFFYSFSASSTPPFHVAVFSFLVFAGYSIWKFLSDGKQPLSLAVFFKMAGGIW